MFSIENSNFSTYTFCPRVETHYSNLIVMKFRNTDLVFWNCKLFVSTNFNLKIIHTLCVATYLLKIMHIRSYSTYKENEQNSIKRNKFNHIFFYLPTYSLQSNENNRFFYFKSLLRRTNNETSTIRKMHTKYLPIL